MGGYKWDLRRHKKEAFWGEKKGKKGDWNARLERIGGTRDEEIGVETP